MKGVARMAGANSRRMVVVVVVVNILVMSSHLDPLKLNDTEERDKKEWRDFPVERRKNN